MLRDTLAILLTLTLTTSLSGCGGDPMGPFAGGELTAPESSNPFTDWRSLPSVDTVFLETQGEAPYSVQTWIIGIDDRLYIPTSLIMGDRAGERRWVQHIQADPNVRLQINDLVYPMRAHRVEDEALHGKVLDAFQEKYASELPEIDEHAQNAWVFRFDAR